MTFPFGEGGLRSKTDEVFKKLAYRNLIHRKRSPFPKGEGYLGFTTLPKREGVMDSRGRLSLQFVPRLNLNAPQRISLAEGKYTPCGACHFVSIVLRTLLTLR